MKNLYSTFTLLLCIFYAKTSSISSTCTIGSVISAGTPCETSVVLGLTKQIASELGSMGISFSSIAGHQSINCKGGCSGFIQESALNSLISITTSANRTITLSSAWRSTAQQYLLYQWKAQAKCGQTNPVFIPGTSNHEGGIAIDVPSYNDWISLLTNNGWNYPMPDTDRVHFEYGNKAAFYAKQNLIAFQRLWNRYNPNDTIAEDGVFGNDTAKAFDNAPCNGWDSLDNLK